jgi:hypothetical protein
MCKIGHEEKKICLNLDALMPRGRGTKPCIYLWNFEKEKLTEVL